MTTTDQQMNRNYNFISFQRYYDSFTNEFFWKLQNIIDVLRGRGEHQVKFKEAVAANVFSLIQNTGGTIGSVVGNAGSMVLSFVGAMKDEQQVSILNAEILSGQWNSLRQLVDEVALDAIQMYAYILSISTEEDAMELGQISAQRVWEYLSSNSLELTKVNMLRGIVKGRSGRWEDDWRNTGIHTDSQNKRFTVSQTTATIILMNFIVIFSYLILCIIIGFT